MGRSVFDNPEALQAANIHPHTGLATDYLNHFNEVIMLLGLVPSMPDMLDDVLAWRPKSYARHFLDTHFRGRALVIAAYEQAPRSVRDPFDAVVADIDALLVGLILVLSDPRERACLMPHVPEAVGELEALIARASAIVHGAVAGAPRAGAGSGAGAGAAAETQAAIDALLAA